MKKHHFLLTVSSSAVGGSNANGHCIFSMNSLVNFGNSSGILKFLSYSDSISSLPYRYSANGYLVSTFCQENASFKTDQNSVSVRARQR